MTLTVWLHGLQDVAPERVARVRRSFDQAEIALRNAPARPDGYGVVLLERIDAGALAQLRQLSSHATVLAVALCEPVPAPDAMWSVLDCGVADLLLWPDGSGSAQQIKARVQRWDTLQQLVDAPAVRDVLVGSSASWRALVRSVAEVAAFTDSAVLITGETGTGKDLLAQLIHRVSGARGPFTVLDCTTLSPELAGSELFGHERGAFTGALAARDGAFALADGGVLFLDEIGELPLALQAQLLRAIQEHSYKRVGSNSWQHSHFRLVCATNRDLATEVAGGRFRADLYYRIAAWRCQTPPLRERPEDILPLAAHFLAELAQQQQQQQQPVAGFDPALRAYLLGRDYPGNVRELRQTVARLWHRHCGPGPITLGALPPEDRPSGAHPGAGWPDRRFEGAIRHALDLGVGLARITQMAADMAIALVLEQEGDNNQRAALRLGVTDRALQIRRKARAST